MDVYKAKLNDAAGKGVDFDQVTQGDQMKPDEMERSMTNLAAEIEPKLDYKKKGVRFGYDPVRGEKIRLDKPKKAESKSDKKKRKAEEFWS